MENSQVLSLAIAGIIVPFLQEILFGARVSGRISVLINAGVSFVIAAFATWVTGGFATAAGAPAFTLIDPSEFFKFWWMQVFAPVFGISQFVFNITTKRKPEGETSGPIQSVADKVTEVAPGITGGTT